MARLRGPIIVHADPQRLCRYAAQQPNSLSARQPVSLSACQPNSSKDYFSRMKILIGVPVNVQCSRILFSR